MTHHDDLRLWPGTRPPQAGTPKRRRGSIRRTTTVDMIRPDGLAGALLLVGQGRDLATGIDDRPYLVAAAATLVGIDPGPGRLITDIRSEPAVEGLGGLVGTRSLSGFRRAVAETVPALVPGSLEHLLLDDTTPAAHISGSVLTRAGLLRLDDPQAKLPVDICAGWQAGGAMLAEIDQTGFPLLGWGPPAPSLENPDDDLAWHPLEPLAPTAMRRRRLIDLWRGVGPDGRSASAPLRVDVRFRDTYGDHDGTEIVVHEYAVSVKVDRETWLVLEATADAGPLPAPECPAAAASISRIVGREVSTLRDLVRHEFSGPSTCTHLNDVIRSLADVRTLWVSGALARGESVEEAP